MIIDETCLCHFSIIRVTLSCEISLSTIQEDGMQIFSLLILTAFCSELTVLIRWSQAIQFGLCYFTVKGYFSSAPHILVGLLRALQTLIDFPALCNPLAALHTIQLPVCFQGKAVFARLSPTFLFFSSRKKHCNGFKLPIKVCSWVCIRLTKRSFPSHCPFEFTKCQYVYSTSLQASKTLTSWNFCHTVMVSFYIPNQFFFRCVFD